jgi:hypothetical protein
MIPLSTVHSRARLNSRLAKLQPASERTISAQELRDVIADVQVINGASDRLLNINFYVPAVMFLVAIIGALVTPSGPTPPDKTAT